MSVITRSPSTDELSILNSIWSRIFGDIGRDSFFRLFYKPELCIIAESNGIVASTGYLVPFGNLMVGDDSIPCAMIFSIATLPEYRGVGLGAAVVDELIAIADSSGYPVAVLCPSEDRLFEYYSKHTRFCDRFYTNEQIFTRDDLSGKSSVPVEISIQEYIKNRDKLLAGTMYIKNDISAFEYQSLLCMELGGGFYRINDWYAVVEREDDKRVFIKEFLFKEDSSSCISSNEITKEATASISELFPADEYIVRFPSRDGKGRRFGMLAATGNDLINDFIYKKIQNCNAAWYGLAFD